MHIYALDDTIVSTLLDFISDQHRAMLVLLCLTFFIDHNDLYFHQAVSDEMISFTSHVSHFLYSFIVDGLAFCHHFLTNVSSTLKNMRLWMSSSAVKGIFHRPDNLSLTLRTHMIEGENYVDRDWPFISQLLRSK